MSETAFTTCEGCPQPEYCAGFAECQHPDVRVRELELRLTQANQWTTTKPMPGTWCWVTDDTHVWLAKYEPASAGGWCNEDTWEDFTRAVSRWIPLLQPDPPSQPRHSERSRNA
jgi:hypothetical protein